MCSSDLPKPQTPNPKPQTPNPKPLLAADITNLILMEETLLSDQRESSVVCKAQTVYRSLRGFFLYCYAGLIYNLLVLLAVNTTAYYKRDIFNKYFDSPVAQWTGSVASVVAVCFGVATEHRAHHSATASLASIVLMNVAICFFTTWHTSANESLVVAATLLTVALVLTLSSISVKWRLDDNYRYSLPLFHLVSIVSIGVLCITGISIANITGREHYRNFSLQVAIHVIVVSGILISSVYGTVENRFVNYINYESSVHHDIICKSIGIILWLFAGNTVE